MLNECLEIFEKELEENGDAIIIDKYIPSDGTYLIVDLDKDEITENLDIKINKKEGKIEAETNSNFNRIRNFDYNSKLIDMNKPIDGKKIIHSNNYLSFFIKKDKLKDSIAYYNLSEDEKKKNSGKGLLNEEIIDKYYEVLSDPKVKYKKPKAKEIYNDVESELGEVNQESLNKAKEWIKRNIFKIEERGVELKDKLYLKIFFEAPIEEYKKEGERYLIPNIYNNNDFNEKIDGVLYGLPNNNMGLNSKKPYLENKTRKVKVPYLVDKERVLLQKKFFDYLMNLASAGKVNIYLNDDNKNRIMSFKNGEMPDKNKRLRRSIYLRIMKSKELEILDYDVIAGYKGKMDKVFEFEDVLDTEKSNSDFYIENEEIDSRSDFQNLINIVLFSKYLTNNYYTDPKDINLNDSILKQNMIVSRNAIFDYIYKANDKNIYRILDRASSNIIKNTINNGHILKAIDQYNLRCSIERYFKGGENMADIISDVKDVLREKINSNDTKEIENDREYYFAVGQFVNYLLSKSKGKNKPHSLANPFINAKNDKVIKEKLRNLYKRYNYDIDMNGKRAKNLYAMIVSYEPDKKVDQDMIIAGYLHSNLIYEKNKGQED